MENGIGPRIRQSQSAMAKALSQGRSVDKTNNQLLPLKISHEESKGKDQPSTSKQSPPAADNNTDAASLKKGKPKHWTSTYPPNPSHISTSYSHKYLPVRRSFSQEECQKMQELFDFQFLWVENHLL